MQLQCKLHRYIVKGFFYVCLNGFRFTYVIVKTTLDLFSFCLKIFLGETFNDIEGSRYLRRDLGNWFGCLQ